MAISKEEINKRARERYAANRETIKKNRDEQREEIRARDRALYQKNRENVLARKKKYYAEHPEEERERYLRNYQKNGKQEREKRKPYARQYYQDNRERIKENYQANRAEIRKQRHEHYLANLDDMRKRGKEDYWKNREKILKKSKAQRDRLKARVFDLLGNKCAQCGLDDIRVLQLDHVNNNGYKERKDLSGQNYRVYNRVLAVNGEGYQLLCANCNWIKKWESHKHSDKYIAKKKRLFDSLGNHCANCGIDDLRVLQIDHVNGDGAKDRELMRKRDEYYRHIIEVNGLGYQTLCANCNWIKRYDNREHTKRYDST